MLEPFIITNNESNQRYDKFLRKYFKRYPLVSLKDIFAWMRKGYIKVNGRKQKEDYRVQIDDEISFPKIPPSEHYKLHNDKKEAVKHINLHETKKRIAYEDSQWLAFDKPAGFVIHGGTKQEHTTSLHDHLQQYLFFNKKNKQTSPQTEDNNQEASTFTPSFCYRLDKDTSGVIIAAITYPALQLLNELIRERKVSKTYHAIVVGDTPDSGSIDKPLFKGFDAKYGRSKSFVNYEKGKFSKSHYKKVATITDEHLGEITLLKVTIETGRMHQIRVHLAHIGFPVLGDIMYGSPVLNRIAHKQHKINRQLLHASEYSFYDTIQEKQISISAGLPQDFQKFFTK